MACVTGQNWQLLPVLDISYGAYGQMLRISRDLDIISSNSHCHINIHCDRLARDQTTTIKHPRDDSCSAPTDQPSSNVHTCQALIGLKLYICLMI